MEKHIFSYKNDGREVITLVIEPWLMIYEIKPLSTIVFTYTSNVKNVDIIGFKDNLVNVYFDFERIRVVLDDRDITRQYPIPMLNE
ncbi:hypothetical protein RFI02_11605 [Acinetobacter sichuanensis]|uniref:hypothetical protein n=1 Tax=Acinetobacter TaxID=469 RepID=UPI002578E488|nr:MULTISPECIES: hypothetical protein [Acinetobacter]MDQ9021754.1 hypothetical protein [Acinetobacter sichuanensis]